MMSIRSSAVLPVLSYYTPTDECVGACVLTGLPLAETVALFIDWMLWCMSTFC